MKNSIFIFTFFFSAFLLTKPVFCQQVPIIKIRNIYNPKTREMLVSLGKGTIKLKGNESLWDLEISVDIEYRNHYPDGFLAAKAQKKYDDYDTSWSVCEKMINSIVGIDYTMKRLTYCTISSASISPFSRGNLYVYFENNNGAVIAKSNPISIIKIKSKKEDDEKEDDEKKKGPDISDIWMGDEDGISEIVYLKTVSNKSIKAYPNPASSSITFETNYAREEEISIQLLYSLTGKKFDVYKGKVNSGKQLFRWNRPKNLQSGVYLYKITSKQGTKSGKVIFK